MSIPGLCKIDIYIIRKFLGTFFFAIAMIMFITIVFDLSEKLDEFMENEAPPKVIMFDYFLNFIPYFAALIAPLFTFIAVIFFTSRMAYNTEIIAILSSGVSFRRLMVPYLIASTIIVVLNIYMNNNVIPKANDERFQFEEKYYHTSSKTFKDRNVHKQVDPGVYVYLESYSTANDYGRKFSMEKFENGKLVSKLMAQDVRWDTATDKWKIRNYMIRNFTEDGEVIETGRAIDTTINLDPEEFKMRDNAIEAMDKETLNKYISTQLLQGSSHVNTLLIEKYRRTAVPFSTFILTLIGVSVSSRKVRGGIGMHIAIGLLLSTSYILFMKFSSEFAISGSLSPLVASWIPNVLYSVIAVILYRLAPK
ncbi:MAG: LptF/LptG family permease [Bacteroidales bacterium]|nr:LptF/LptG family permease [Bacteroidales bacterium]MBN2819212.1 LptF/LptG family permease [Bacteroidales bacterium]